MRCWHTVRAAKAAAVFLFIGLNPGLLWAGSFHVAPVRVDLSTQQTSAALNVENNGDEPVVIQLQATAWSQDNGQDQYPASADLLATPPIFTIQPGAAQIVRIGMRRPASVDHELSYRLFLQEVPPPPKPGFRGLQVALRIGIPVFVQPKTKVAPVLNWKLERQTRNNIKVNLKNDGNAHVQVIDFSVTRPDDRTLAIQQVSTYLLPGQSRNWVLPTDPGQPFSGDKVHVIVNTDTGKVETDATLEQP